MKVSVFGSCVSRDIFRYTDYRAYEIGVTIGRNPISILFSEGWNGIERLLAVSELKSRYIKKCIELMWEKNVCDLLNSYKADYLIIDLAEERLNKLQVQCEERNVELVEIDAINQLLDEISQRSTSKLAITKFSYKNKSYDIIRESYKKFYAQIIETQGKGIWREEQIIVIEAYLVPQYITSIGTLKKYSDYWNVKEINSYLKMCYEIFYEIFPNCIRIQLPEYVHGNFYHKWGANPLHYQDSAYKYFAKAIDIISGRSESASLDKLRKMQSIENRLYTSISQFN